MQAPHTIDALFLSGDQYARDPGVLLLSFKEAPCTCGLLVLELLFPRPVDMWICGASVCRTEPANLL